MAWTPDSEPSASWAGDSVPVLGPELFVDRSFEDNDPAWERTPRADRVEQGTAFRGSWVHDCEWDRTPGSAFGAFGQQFTLTNWTYPHLLTCWARMTQCAGADVADQRMRIGVWQGHFSQTTLKGDQTHIAETLITQLDLADSRTTPGLFEFLNPYGDWKPFQLAFVPGSPTITLSMQGKYVGSNPSAIWSTTTEFDFFSLKQMYWDAEADPPDPSYSPQTENPSIYTRDPG